MNPTRKALELVEPLLNNRYWVRIATGAKTCFVTAGPLHDNGFKETATHQFLIDDEGRVVESHSRI